LLAVSTGYLSPGLWLGPGACQCTWRASFSDFCRRFADTALPLSHRQLLAACCCGVGLGQVHTKLRQVHRPSFRVLIWYLLGAFCAVLAAKSARRYVLKRPGQLTNRPSSRKESGSHIKSNTSQILLSSTAYYDFLFSLFFSWFCRE
jgi:hypothetical protein